MILNLPEKRITQHGKNADRPEILESCGSARIFFRPCPARRPLCARAQRVAVTLFLSLLLGLSTASAQGRRAPTGRSWRISEFQTTIAVDQSGGADIIERISLVFIGSWHGIYRSIPVIYPGPAGGEFKLDLKLISIEDDDLKPLEFETTSSHGYEKFKIFLPGATDTSKTVRIHYAVRNGIRFFDDHEEFYFNVTGNDWPVPIDHALATVRFPPGAAGVLRAQAFTGTYGATLREATAAVKGSQVLFETSNPLPMRAGLTIDVFLPKGTLTEPSALTRLGWFLSANPMLLLPVWTFGVMFTLWWFKGKDPRVGRSIAPQYEPPKNISPAEAGTLITDEVENRDITSIIVDLAVRGYMRIEEKTRETFIWSNKDYDFHLLKPMPQWGDLAPYERVMLEHIFWGGEKTSLSDLHNRFYIAVPMLKMDVMTALKKKGMYTLSPEASHVWTAAGGMIAAAPIFLLAIKGLFILNAIAIGCVAVSAIIVYLFGRKMSAKSTLGQQTYVEILGFQEFMRRVDADRLKRMPPDTFEKYLPYAMALGVEHNWAKAFSSIAQNPPTWYQSSDGRLFNSYMFVNDVGAMTTQASAVFESAPRASSSDSGFSGSGSSSGGGFSGGGFGGGGGDAF